MSLPWILLGGIFLFKVSSNNHGCSTLDNKPNQDKGNAQDRGNARDEEMPEIEEMVEIEEMLEIGDCSR